MITRPFEVSPSGWGEVKKGCAQTEGRSARVDESGGTAGGSEAQGGRARDSLSTTAANHCSLLAGMP